MGVICLLALSVSLDTLGIGMAYAMKGVSIPWKTKYLIGIINMVFTALAVGFGYPLSHWIPSRWFRYVSGILLMVIGAKTVICVWQKKDTRDYDRDDSHSLDPMEGIALALSMSLDSMCAGLGLCGQSAGIYCFPVLTGFLSVIFLWVGTRFWFRIRAEANLLSGGILILLGFFRFFIS